MSPVFRQTRRCQQQTMFLRLEQPGKGITAQLFACWAMTFGGTRHRAEDLDNRSLKMGGGGI